MSRLLSFVMLLCVLSLGQPYPYAAAPLPVVPPVVPPVVSPVAPLIPTAYPYAQTVRPVIPGVPGYNNALVPGVPGYRNPLVPGVPGYTNPLIPGAAGYNNPYYNQYRAPGAAVPILTYSSEHIGDGTYSFSFTTADGKQAQEAGYLKDAYIDNSGEPQGTQVIQGSYAYISPEGTPIQVSYIADENGFRPSGVHIPADGKAVVPLLGDKEKQIIDPLYNRYDPLYRSRYNGLTPFNRAPYDPRNPYNAARYNLSNQYLAPTIDTNAKETKKST